MYTYVYLYIHALPHTHTQVYQLYEGDKDWNVTEGQPVAGSNLTYPAVTGRSSVGVDGGAHAKNGNVANVTECHRSPVLSGSKVF